MKKSLSLIIILGMVIGMVACTGKPVKEDVYDTEKTFIDSHYPEMEGYRSDDNRWEYPIMQEDL